MRTYINHVIEPEDVIECYESGSESCLRFGTIGRQVIVSMRTEDLLRLHDAIGDRLDALDADGLPLDGHPTIPIRQVHEMIAATMGED